MLSLQTFKKSLGATGKQFTEVETQELLDFQYRLANVLFDIWHQKTRTEVEGGVIMVNKKNGNWIVVDLRWSIFSYVYA